MTPEIHICFYRIQISPCFTYVKLKKFTERLDGSFKILPDMYFTCPKKFHSAVHKYCWQNITLCKLNGNYIFNFESITHKEWKECFEN